MHFKWRTVEAMILRHISSYLSIECFNSQLVFWTTFLLKVPFIPDPVIWWDYKGGNLRWVFGKRGSSARTSIVRETRRLIPPVSLPEYCNVQSNVFPLYDTVPFHSIRQSRVTGPSKMPKCHGCHGDFHGVPNSFGNHVTNIEIFRRLRLNCRKIPKNLGMSRQLWEVAETKISAGLSRVTGPAKLNEMVQ